MFKYKSRKYQLVTVGGISPGQRQYLWCVPTFQDLWHFLSFSSGEGTFVGQMLGCAMSPGLTSLQSSSCFSRKRCNESQNSPCQNLNGQGDELGHRPSVSNGSCGRQQVQFFAFVLRLIYISMYAFGGKLRTIAGQQSTYSVVAHFFFFFPSFQHVSWNLEILYMKCLQRYFSLLAQTLKKSISSAPKRYSGGSLATGERINTSCSALLAKYEQSNKII